MPERARRGTIGWGDALAAAAQLGVRDAGEARILLQLLGLLDDAPADASATDGEPPGDMAGAVARTMRPGTDPAGADDVSGAAATAQRGPATAAVELAPDPVGRLTLDAEPLAPPIASPPVRYEAPIPAVRLPGALAHLVRRPRPARAVDVEACVELAVSGQPLVRVPRVVEPSTALGVQVVADVGASMLPYLDDVRHLIRAVREVVGEPRVSVHRVDDGTAPPEPSQNAPILVLSCLAAVRPMSVPQGNRQQWERFAAQVQALGADAVALVPHRDRTRLPELPAALRIVAWDELQRIEGHRATGASGATASLPPPGAAAARILDSTHRARREGITGDRVNGDEQVTAEHAAAERAVAALSRRRPDVVALARWAAVAAIVEPALLRRLRLEVPGPSLDAGTEADLWFSDLVHVATATELTLRRPVADVLRRQLARAEWRTAAAVARAIVKDTHRGHSDMLRLEERIIWAGVQGDTDDVRAALERALATLQLGGERATDVVRWFRQAQRRLPSAALRTEHGALLTLAARRHTDRRVPASVLAADRFPDAVGAITAGALPEVAVEVRIVPGGLEVLDAGVPDGGQIYVPDTVPLVVEASWGDADGRRHRDVVPLTPGRRTPLEGLLDRVVVRTLSGRRFRLTEQPPELVERGGFLLVPIDLRGSGDGTEGPGGVGSLEAVTVALRRLPVATAHLVVQPSQVRRALPQLLRGARSALISISAHFRRLPDGRLVAGPADELARSGEDAVGVWPGESLDVHDLGVALGPQTRELLVLLCGPTEDLRDVLRPHEFPLAWHGANTWIGVVSLPADVQQAAADVFAHGPAQYSRAWNPRCAAVRLADAVDALAALAPAHAVTWIETRPRWKGPGQLPNPRYDPDVRSTLPESGDGVVPADVMAAVVGAIRQGERGLFALVGAAGSGRTGTLARLAALSEPSARDGIEAESGLPTSTLDPGPLAVDAAVDVTGLTLQDVVAAVARQLGVQVESSRPGQLVDLVDRSRQPLVLILDGVDDSADARAVVDQLVAPLAARCLVFLGCRYEGRLGPLPRPVNRIYYLGRPPRPPGEPAAGPQGEAGAPQPATSRAARAGERAPGSVFEEFRPVFGPERLFGRTAELASLLERRRRRHPVALLGPRRAGKSSLLLALVRRLSVEVTASGHDPGVRYGSIAGLPEGATADLLARWLGRGHLDKTSAASPVAQLLGQAKRRHQEGDPLTVLVDEAGLLSRCDDSAWRLLHTLHVQGAWIVYCATHGEWSDLCQVAGADGSEPFTADVTTLRLGPLAQADAVALLTTGLAQLQLGIDLPGERLVREVLPVTGGWPYYLNVAGRALANHLRELPVPTQADGMRELLVEALVDEQAVYFRHRWDEIGDAGRAALLATPGAWPTQLTAPQREDLLRAGLLQLHGEWVEEPPLLLWVQRNADALRRGSQP